MLCHITSGSGHSGSPYRLGLARDLPKTLAQGQALDTVLGSVGWR